MALALLLFAAGASADEKLVTDPVPYILDAESASPRYVVILFPGGTGQVNPRLMNGKLTYGFRGNFLVRSRPLLVDAEFATVTTNTTSDPGRVQALLDDLKRRYPAAKVYLMGTSNGTAATMALAPYLSERIAGVIHTSSLSEIYRFDARQFKNRQLIVHHKDDACRVTPFFAAEAAGRRGGADFIAMQGGVSVGNPCEAFAHHGYTGIERETIDAIKAWIRKG